MNPGKISPVSKGQAVQTLQLQGCRVLHFMERQAIVSMQMVVDAGQGWNIPVDTTDWPGGGCPYSGLNHLSDIYTNTLREEYRTLLGFGFHSPALNLGWASTGVGASAAHKLPGTESSRQVMVRALFPSPCPGEPCRIWW